MTVEDKIDDKELKDINPQRDGYEDEIIQIIKSDEPAYKKKEENFTLSWDLKKFQRFSLS